MDVMSTTRELKINNLFVDGDTRTITLKNPKETITSAEIEELETLIKNGTGEQSILVGDKYGSDFKRIQTVTKIEKTTVNYDISQ